MERSRVTPGGFFAAVGKALCALLLFLGCQTLVSLAFAAAAAIYLGVQGHFTDPVLFSQQVMIFTMGYSGQITLLSNALTVLILALFFLLRRQNPLKGVCLTPCPPATLAGAAVAAPLLYLAVSCVLFMLPAAWLDSYADASSALLQPGIFSALATVLAAPIAEEVIFRGYILSRLRRGMPDGVALLLSAAIFGVCHAQPVWIAYAFALGLVFGLMTLRTGSILPSLITHLGFNAVGQLFASLPEEGLSEEMTAAVALVLCVLVWLTRKSLSALFLPKKREDTP